MSIGWRPALAVVVAAAITAPGTVAAHAEPDPTFAASPPPLTLSGAPSTPAAEVSAATTNPLPPAPGMIDSELVVAAVSPNGLPEDAVIYDQLSAVGLPSRVVGNPTSTTDLRYVDERGAPTVVDGMAQITVGGDVPTVTTKATFSRPMPVALHAEYRTSTTAISPESVPGRSGTLQARYTVTNTTAKNEDITYSASDGTSHTDNLPVFAPYVGTLQVEVPSGASLVEAPGAVIETTPEGRTTATWSLVLYPPLGDYTQVATISLGGDIASVPALQMEVVPVTSAEDPATAFTTELLTKSVSGNASLTDGLAELDQGATDLAAGTADLHSGMDQLAQGNSELAVGLNDAHAGSVELADGIDQLSLGLTSVAEGLDRLAATAAAPELANQAHAAAAAAAALSATLGFAGDTPAAGTVAGLVSGVAYDAAALSAQASSVAAELEAVASVKVAAVAEQAATAGARADSAAQALARAQDQLCDPDPTRPGCDALGQASADLAAAQAAAWSASQTAQEAATALSSVDAGLATVSATATSVGNAAAELQQSIVGLAATVSEGGPGAPGLLPALASVAASADALARMIGQLASGAWMFADGAQELSAGGHELSDGLGQASSGADELAGGAFELAEGSRQAADGAAELQSQGTSRIYSEVVASSEDPAFASAYLAATQTRTTDAMPYGAPEGADGRAAYLLTLTPPPSGDPVNGGAVAALTVVAVLIGTVTAARIRRPRGGVAADGDDGHE